MQARAEDAERKVAGVTGEIATAKTVAMSEYQSSAKFEQVCADNYDEGVRTFIYNVCARAPRVGPVFPWGGS